MKTYIRYLLISLPAICGLFSSCTEETQFNTSDYTGQGRVILSYSVGNQSQSRATTETEAGWDGEWNENKVTRLDLFIFRGNGNQLVTHLTNTDISYNDADETYSNVTETLADDWVIDDLSPNDIQAGDQIYLIANNESVGDINTLAGLQEAFLDELTCNAKQNSFVMVGSGDDVTITRSGNDVTISVDLIRVAAKIRLSFTNTSLTDVSYRFVNYASTSALLEESEATYLASQTLSVFPLGDGLQAITLNDENLYIDNSTQKLVLYSYANDWYEEGEDYTNEDVNNETMSDDQIYKEEPINEEKQTYILLRAPYDGKYYYYKVPVNYRLPENNDAVDIDKDSYKHLYRLQRNYIYDITVSIDRPGGPEYEPIELPLNILVVPWGEKDITIPAFK